MPAVSVITPAFNAAALVGRTIRSVQAQTFEDWEMLVVDDGSTDETREMVQDHCERDGRIHLLRQENRGPSAARNHAMREARGDWFAFLDSDDTWDPEYLAGQLAVFEAHPETAVVTGVARYLGGPRSGRAMRQYTPGYPVLTLRDIIADDTAVFIMTVFRRAVFEAIGGMDEAQWRSEDYDFWLRAAAAGFVFRRNARPLGHYSVREGSLSRSAVAMLEGLLTSYGKVRSSCVAGSPEREALDVQMARFEGELLLARAKLALERRNVGEAAAHLRALRSRGGGTLIGVTAWLAEHAPQAAILAYRVRHLRRFASRASRRQRAPEATAA